MASAAPSAPIFLSHVGRTLLVCAVFALPFAQCLSQQRISRGGGGNAQQHPNRPTQGAANCDCRQHPDGRQVDFRTHHLWVNKMERGRTVFFSLVFLRSSRSNIRIGTLKISASTIPISSGEKRLARKPTALTTLLTCRIPRKISTQQVNTPTIHLPISRRAFCVSISHLVFCV